MSVRFEIAGSVVRFFPERRPAIQAANARTQNSNEQHRAMRSDRGFYVVQNVVTKELFDVDGRIPAGAAQLIVAEGLEDR